MASNIDVQDPSLQYHPFSGRVSVYLFGRPLDWSLTPEKEEDRRDVYQRIGTWVMEHLGATDVYAPRPSTFNAQVCSPKDLKEVIGLETGVNMFRGCNADGVEIPAGAAFWLSSADCITIVACEPESGKTVAAHGGRDCLIDRGRLNSSVPRQFESVVHAICARFSEKQRKALHVFLTCGIGPENFEHACNDPKHGPSNTKMAFDVLSKWGPTCLYGDHYKGRLSLPEVIRSQFLSLGVAAHRIGYDGVETFNDRGPDGDYRWWSHRRAEDEEDKKKRNGVLVVRNW